MDYEKQLNKKHREVKRAFRQLWKSGAGYWDAGAISLSEQGQCYVSAAENGTVISEHISREHSVVKIDECQIEDKIADGIIYDIRGMLRSFKIKVYDEDSGYGLLRHVLVRRGFRTGEVMVVLVLASPILPSKTIS